MTFFIWIKIEGCIMNGSVTVYFVEGRANKLKQLEGLICMIRKVKNPENEES